MSEFLRSEYECFENVGTKALKTVTTATVKVMAVQTLKGHDPVARMYSGRIQNRREISTVSEEPQGVNNIFCSYAECIQFGEQHLQYLL
jgi:hypothetical protein